MNIIGVYDDQCALQMDFCGLTGDTGSLLLGEINIPYSFKQICLNMGVLRVFIFCLGLAFVTYINNYIYFLSFLFLLASSVSISYQCSSVWEKVSKDSNQILNVEFCSRRTDARTH